MKRPFTLLVCLVALASSFAAEPSKPSSAVMKETLHAVVRGQLEAFRRGDFPAAYELAAPGIREKFSIEAFTEMVRGSYPEIAGNTGVVFGLTFDNGERAVISVRIIGKHRASRRYQYLIDRHGSDWRIGGVVILEEDETSI